MKKKTVINSRTILTGILIAVVISFFVILAVGRFAFSSFKTYETAQDDARVAAFVKHAEKAEGQEKELFLNTAKLTDTYSLVLTNQVEGKICETAMSYGLLVSTQSEEEWLPKGVTLTASKAGTYTELPFVWNADEKGYLLQNAGAFPANEAQTDTWSVVFTLDPETVEGSSLTESIRIDALFTQID